MPAAISAASVSGVAEAGPIVATIFVRRVCPVTAVTLVPLGFAAGGVRPLRAGTRPSRGTTASSPSSSSIRRSWLYFATRSERVGAPVLIWPAFVATARSAIVASSVSPERCEMIARYPLRCASSMASSVSVSVPIWLTLTRIAFADALVDPAAEEVDVRDEQIVADELHAAAEPVGQRLPPVPVGLAEPVLDRDDREPVAEVGPEVDHPRRVERAALALEHVRAVAVQLARRRVERDRHLVAVTCALGGLEDRLAGVVRRAEVGGEPALVADARSRARAPRAAA